jgi:hypothetical protein
MAHTVKHFSLHRIAGTELRVIADVEVGVLPVIQVEESVIRGYTSTGGSEPRSSWPHRWVTLFVLQDLQPLVRQFRPEADLPPGGAAALAYRPVVNVYDLADPAGCHVFVNRQAMVKEGYWDDPLAIQGLLAHEHAHPLAENETARASRRLQVELSLERSPSTENRRDKIHRLLTLLADKLCLYAPREVFANEVTIHSGFGEALFHLDKRNVANATRSVAGREELRLQLQQEVTQGNLTPTAADLLLLIGDLKGYLDLALEVAPFYRMGQDTEAQELETILETGVFPHLEPEVPRAYAALRERYVALRTDLTPPELMSWGEGTLNILVEVLAEKGLILRYRLQRTDKSDA